MAEKLRKITTRIIEIDPRELRLLSLNARYMKHEQFHRLVQNIKDDGALTSVPFACIDDDGKYLVLSGNHRTKAAIEAGLDKIQVLVTDDKLPKNRKTALQIAHNAITGQDDPAILKQIYESIDDIDWKLYSGLDDKTLELLEKVQPESMSEANLQFQMIQVVFLPSELERAKDVIEKALKDAKGCDEVWLNRFSEYDKWLDSIEETGAAYNVKNTATSIMRMMDVYEKHRTDLSEAFIDGENLKHKNWVPIASVIGTEKIPAQLALIIKKALDNAVSTGEIPADKLWKILEKVFA